MNNHPRYSKSSKKRQRKSARQQQGQSQLAYGNLEPKLPLDASFSHNADADVLTLSGFTPDETVFINQTEENVIISLGNGVWTQPSTMEVTVVGGTMTVDPDEFDNLRIFGLSETSTLTFGGNNDFGGTEIRVDGEAGFVVEQFNSGGNQAGFVADDLTIFGGNIFLDGNRNQIANLSANNVESLSFTSLESFTLENLSTVGSGDVLDENGEIVNDGVALITTGNGDNVTIDSVDDVGTLTLDVGGNVTRQIDDNDLVANQLFLDVEGSFTVENLRVAEISGDVQGNFVITDSDNNFTNLTDTVITSDFFPGLEVNGTLDWTIRGTSLTQNVDAPLQLSLATRVVDNPFLDSDSDAGAATFRLETFTQAETLLLAESDDNDFGSVNVIYIDQTTFITNSQVPRIRRFNAIEFSDRDSIIVQNINTNFIPTELDQTGPNTFDSRIRISAGRGLVAGDDFPVLIGNQIGSVTITGQIEGENLLLQAPGGFNASAADIDTNHLFLGGDLETEGRANFQIDADSLEELSVNVFDSFDVTTQQELAIVAGQYPILSDPLIAAPANTEVFTTAAAGEFARISSTRLDFEVPFTSRKLSADISTDIEQASGAVLTIDDLQIQAKRTVLDDTNNNFQRIAVVGDGFTNQFTDGQSNNDEDVLVIRDQGTLQIASLDNQPIDPTLTSFSTAVASQVINGISIDGTVDIETGHGGEVTTPRIGGPSAEQIGSTGRVEQFTLLPGRTDGVFRDDNYDGAVRPAYFIEFIYDGTSGLRIQSDAFERRDPELVRNQIDIELALYNEAGDLLAVDDDDSSNEFDVLTLADVDPSFLFNGNLPAGRYYVAASAFATEFEDGFVVNTSNNRTGTLNVTIDNGAAFVAPEVGRDLTQTPDAPLIVTGGEEVGDVEDGEPDGSVRLSALSGGAVLLAETDLNDVRELTVTNAVGLEFTDADDVDIISTVADGLTFAQLSAGRSATGGVLTLGDFSADEALLQADSGIVSTGELDIRKLLIGGSEARDSGGDIAIISPNTEELAFQFVDGVAGDGTASFDTDIAFATSQDLTIGSFEYRDSGIVLSQSRADEIRIQAQSLTVNGTLEAVTKMVVEVDDTLIAATPAGTPGISTPQLFFTGAALDLSQSDNPIGQISAATNGDGGDVQLQSSIATNVAILDNQIDVGTLPTSDTLNFNAANTLEGVTSRNDLDFNVLRLTQDADSVLRGRVLTVTTTGVDGVLPGQGPVDPDPVEPVDPNAPVMLPTGPEVDNGTRIDNDVVTDTAGFFEATIGSGNSVNSSQLTLEQIDGTLLTADLVFSYETYVRVGNTTTRLDATTITQTATLISDDVVESRGSFTGPNGLVNWIATSRFDDGIAIVYTTLALEAATGTTLGDVQVISYLDEDIQGVSDDFLTTTGTPGQSDFRAFTLDGPNRVGFAQGGFYSNDGTNQINATYNGWAADQFRDLASAIEASTQTFSIDGTIDLVDLPTLADPDFSPAFGPDDVTTAFAWSTVPTATNSTITSFLEFLPTVESTGPVEPVEPVEPIDPEVVGDVILDQNNSISQLIIPTAFEVSFNNDRQFTALDVNARSTVDLTAQAGDVVVETINTPFFVTLNAADDVRDTAPLDSNRINAASLTVNAGNNNVESTFNGVLLQTNVDTIDVDVANATSGEVILRELTGVTLERIAAGGGKINILANGTINADLVRYNSANANNEILLNANTTIATSDIVVGEILASAGDVKLFAGDDVYHAATPPNNAQPLVSGFNLFTFVRNQTADSNSGINLNTAVVTATAVVGRFTDANPNEGNIVINELDHIRVDLAKTRLGSIDITSGQNLVAMFVQAEGVNNGDAVTLTTTGIGGDVVPDQVVSRGGTGGIAINAADDIRDFNPANNKSLVARSVTMRAQNNFQDAFNGIIAQTRTNQMSAQVSSTSVAEMHVFNQGALALNDTFITNGNIGVTNSGGNLSAMNVRSGGQANSRIFLRTQGAGADISVGNLVAADRGEVILNAADDIFDSNFADDIFIEAEFLSATARNNRSEVFDGILLNADIDSLFVSQPNGGEEIIRRR